MGEQADLILNGDLCEGCGEDFLEDGPGYPRSCSRCGGHNGESAEDDEDYSDMEWAKDARKERRATLEPPRMAYAKKELSKLGECVRYEIVGGGDQLAIYIHVNRIDFWPFTGWFCGRKPIGNIKGRGIANLIKEIKKLCSPNLPTT